MRYGMVIDLKRCIGCYGCQVFCKAKNATPPGICWSRVLFYESGRYPTVRKIPLPVLCMHCGAPACVDVCPSGASVRRSDGIVTVDSAECYGCGLCASACPCEAIALTEVRVPSHIPRAEGDEPAFVLPE